MYTSDERLSNRNFLQVLFSPTTHDMRSDQHSWCKKDCVNRPVQLFYLSGTYAQHRCWPRDANQLKSEAADHQVSGLGSCKVRR